MAGRQRDPQRRADRKQPGRALPVALRPGVGRRGQRQVRRIRLQDGMMVEDRQSLVAGHCRQIAMPADAGGMAHRQVAAFHDVFRRDFPVGCPAELFAGGFDVSFHLKGADQVRNAGKTVGDRGRIGDQRDHDPAPPDLAAHRGQGDPVLAEAVVPRHGRCGVQGAVEVIGRAVTGADGGAGGAAPLRQGGHAVAADLGHRRHMPAPVARYKDRLARDFHGQMAPRRAQHIGATRAKPVARKDVPLVQRGEPCRGTDRLRHGDGLAKGQGHIGAQPGGWGQGGVMPGHRAFLREVGGPGGPQPAGRGAGIGPGPCFRERNKSSAPVKPYHPLFSSGSRSAKSSACVVMAQRAYNCLRNTFTVCGDTASRSPIETEECPRRIKSATSA